MEKVKSAIIGKMWANAEKNELMPSSYILPNDMEFQANQSFLINNLTFRTDRNLSTPVNVKKGAALYFYANKKRDGKRDADFSVSVLLSESEANQIIENSRKGAQAWRESHKA